MPEIEAGRRSDIGEGVCRQVYDAGRDAAPAHSPAAIEQIAVAQQEQMRVQRPIEGARSERRPIETDVIGLRHSVVAAACTETGDSEDAAVSLSYQRWIPAAVRHVADSNPFLQDWIEQPR